MTFAREQAESYVPDGRSLVEAMRGVTHLGVGAHHDDLEFMAFHGIAECIDAGGSAFCGVVCTDGSGSARAGKFARYSADEMRAARRAEQREAARVGGYAAMIQLDYPSASLADPGCTLEDDLRAVLEAAKPGVLYAHNPADKHPTHIGVLAATLRAIWSLPREDRPRKVLGCEVWRDLDWLPDDEKVALDVTRHADLSDRLNRIFESQIVGGKRYDLAIPGRRQANATFFDSHATDASGQVTFAMDLTPLALDGSARDVAPYVLAAVDRFRDDVRQKLEKAFAGDSA